MASNPINLKGFRHRSNERQISIGTTSHAFLTAALLLKWLGENEIEAAQVTLLENGCGALIIPSTQMNDLILADDFLRIVRVIYGEVESAEGRMRTNPDRTSVAFHFQTELRNFNRHFLFGGAMKVVLGCAERIREAREELKRKSESGEGGR